MKAAINTTIRGTFTVKACNAGTLDESLPITYTLHVVTAGGAIDFGFLSVEKAKATADLLWNASTPDYITITNDATAEVLYMYEVASALPF